MEKATVRVAVVAALTLALVAACEGTPSTPYSRTPLAPDPPVPPVVERTLTGNWSGSIGYLGYYYYGVVAYATLTQTGSTVVGTIYCGGPCGFSGMSLSGTVDSTEFNAAGDYASPHGAGSCSFQGMVSNDATRIEGSYRCSRGTGDLQLSKQATIPELPSCVPEILSPAPGVLMDNGRTDQRDVLDWAFDWSDCTGANEYQIVVYGARATIPIIYESSPASSFRFIECGSYIIPQNQVGWRLWLRAKVNDVWGRWSPERNFDVERADSDPLLNCSAGAASK